MIPEELLKELRYVEIYTLKAARNFLVGDYQSPLRGRGFEFDQHKRYQQGDDYRQIDWNVTARMRRPYVKRDFEEKEMDAVILADLSRSMEFSTTDQSKNSLLLQIVAALAFSAANDNMKVGMLGFTDTVELKIPGKKGLSQVWRILQALWDFKPRQTNTDFANLLQHLDDYLKRPSLLFLISDFISNENIFASHSLGHIVQRHDLIPVILEDSWEEALPEGKGFLRLQDAESGGEMVLDLSEKKRRLYARLMRERKIGIQRSLYRFHLDHIIVRTGEPYLEQIMKFFFGRKRVR